MKKIVFIWDFHDTLEDGTIELLAKIANILLKKNGSNKKYTARELASLPSFSWETFFAAHLPHLTKKEIIKVSDSAYDENLFSDLRRKHSCIKAGAKLVLSRIKKNGGVNIIISNSKQDKLGVYLKHIGVDGFIDEYHGIDNGRIRTKKDVLKCKIAAAKSSLLKYKDYDIYAAGDSENDFHMAKAVGAKSFFWILQRFEKNNAQKQYTDMKPMPKFIKKLTEILPLIK
jgi:phosphoglycolate phosphatase-like HAD superfamily hydrolase